MAKKFETIILKLQSSKKLSLFEALIHYCELNGLEPEAIASSVRSNKKLKERLYAEAEILKMVAPIKRLLDENNIL